MFEKEAMKDYVDNLEGKLEVNNESRLEEQFEDTFIRGAVCGYSKAIEWHYPSKGELPTHDCVVLLHWESAIGSNTVITCYKKGKFSQPYNRKDITVAWQEIIPPKEIE